jgi:hypothetical protein
MSDVVVSLILLGTLIALLLLGLCVFIKGAIDLARLQTHTPSIHKRNRQQPRLARNAADQDTDTTRVERAA